MEVRHFNRQKVVWQLNNATREAISRYNQENPVRSEVFRTKDSLDKVHFELYLEGNEFVFRIVIEWARKTNAELSFKVDVRMMRSHNTAFVFYEGIYQKKNEYRFDNYLHHLTENKRPEKFERILIIAVDFQLCMFHECDKDFGRDGEPYNDNAMADGIGSLFNSPDFSDVKIICSDRTEFAAHKGVLATRSSVFKAMLTMETVEENSGTITIDDIDGETMKHILLFLYKGLNSALFGLGYELALKIMNAAEKYDLSDLKKICAMNLENIIDTENVITILLIAEKFQEDDLKYYCVHFIAAHFIKLMRTDEWKLLNSAVLTAIMEVMQEKEFEIIALGNTL